VISPLTRTEAAVPACPPVVLPADGAGLPPDEELRAALAPRFSLAGVGRPHTVRRTWLDTFDWRLHRAGFTLAHVTGPRPAQLVLAGPDGRTARQPASRLTWPALAGGLPAGPVRDRLEALAGIRALLPAARTVSAQRELRVLNADAKTVAWIELDQTSVSQPASAQLPAQLRVSPVRGYQGQAERVTQLLAPGAGGPPPDGLLDAALAAAGRRPEDYSGKLDVRLSPGMPACLALRAVLLDLLDTLQANVPGTIRDIDTEFLHDLRVAVRRTRSALKLAGDVLPPGLAARFRPEFKWLGDLTTPTRDLDVYLLDYPDMAAALVSAKAAELVPFHTHLREQRAAEYRKLARGLRSARFTRLAGDWRRELTGLAAGRDGPRVAGLAAGRIRRAHRRVLRQGCAITPDSPDDRLHNLRKRCKELRYLLEFFASIYEPRAHQRVVKDLKGLQDCLGEFQDRHVQQEEIRVFATQMITEPDMPATALLAMGELAGQLGLSQQRARAEFAGQFRRFADPASEHRFRAMIGGPR
jgi:CHAD domain-containing protein